MRNDQLFAIVTSKLKGGTQPADCYTKTQTDNLLAEKVDKVTGKGLSSNDYDDEAVAEVAKVTNKVDKVDGKGLSTNDYTNAAAAEVAKVANKVDKVTGKGLSTNDYDNTEKAEVAKIVNKVDKVTGKALSTNDYSDEEKAKVAKNVTDIKAINNNVTELKMLGWNVPSDFPIQNTVSGNTFTQKVGRVKLSDLGFGYASSLFQYSFAEAKKPSANNVVANIYTSNYKTVFYYSGGQGVSTNDKSIALDMNGKLYVKDSTYTDVTTFKNANNDVYLYYELATYKTFNIDGNEVSERIENDLSDYGLNNVFDGELKQGAYQQDGGAFVVTQNHVSSNNKIPCNANDIVTLKYVTSMSVIGIRFYKSDNTYISGVNGSNVSQISSVAPSGTAYCMFTIGSSGTFLVSQVGHVGVYVNNQIDVVKNELSPNAMKELGIQLSSNNGFEVTIRKAFYNSYMYIIDLKITTTESVSVGWYTIGSPTVAGCKDISWTPCFLENTSKYSIANIRIYNNVIQLVPTETIASGKTLHYILVGTRG